MQRIAEKITYSTYFTQLLQIYIVQHETPPADDETELRFQPVIGFPVPLYSYIKGMMASKPAIYTIGHSNHELAEFIAMLRHHEVKFLVDVRAFPRSRTNPQSNVDSLPVSLQEQGIGYRHIAALGGLRGRQKKKETSPNSYWQNLSFRNYADYAMTADFRQGLKELQELSRQHRCAIMCAEAVWWRCHRRIISDYLLAENYPVLHIMSDKRVDPATITSAAETQKNGALLYLESQDGI